MVFNYMLILVVLLLFAGLGLDAGMLELKYMQMTFAARAAATAAALSRERGGSSATLQLAGKTASAFNGFTDGANGASVTIQNPPAAGNYSGNAYSVRSVITQSVTTSFMSLVGFKTLSLTATSDNPGAVLTTFTSSFNIHAIFTDSTAVTNGGFDNATYAFSANTLGTVRAGGGLGALISWRGNIFYLGPPNTVNGANNTTLSLTQAKFSQLLMLASTAYGPVLNTPFVVTYTDSSTATTNLSMSDWCIPLSYTNEVIVQQSGYRLFSNSGPWYDSRPNIYGYAINLNNGKTFKSLTLPNNRNVVVFAIDLVP